DDLLEGGLGPLDQVGGQALELGAGELLVQVQRSLGGGRDVGQVDLRLAGAGEFDLGLLGGLTQTLQGHLVLGQVDALRILEAFDQPVDDGLVPVVTTEVVVTVGGLDLHDAVTDLQEGDVEGTTTEVVDEDGGLRSDLGLLGGLTQTLQGHLVLGQVDALRILEAFDQPVDDGLVPVVTTEVVVTVGGLDLHDAVTDLQEGDVEGTTTEVVDEDGGL